MSSVAETAGITLEVKADAKALIVANDDVPGWMMAMTLDDGVDNDTVLNEIKFDALLAKSGFTRLAEGPRFEAPQ